MDWKQSLDRYLTTPPDDGFDDYCDAVIQAIDDKFFTANEKWILGEKGDKLLVECFKSGMDIQQAVKVIKEEK